VTPRRLLLLGHPQHAGAAFANLLEELVMANQGARSFFMRGGMLHRLPSEKAVGAFVGGDERSQASEVSNISSASLRQERAAFGGRLREYVREKRLFAGGYPVHGDRKFGRREGDRVVSVDPGRDWL
jgi:hypothetical protein